MARVKDGQNKSDARLEVEKIVFKYLKSSNIEFQSNNIVNLPINKEGKINMSQLSKNMGLSESQRKNHMYKDEDIKNEINRHAIRQGIKPLQQSQNINTICNNEHTIEISNKQIKQTREQLVEVQSQNEQLVIENRKLQAKIKQYEAAIQDFFSTGTMPYIQDW